MTEPADFDTVWESEIVKTVSPNEQIFVDIHGNRDVQVSIDDGYYARYSAAEFQTQFARTLRLAFVNRTKAFFALRSEIAGTHVHPGSTLVNEHMADFYRRRDELAVEGCSSDESVELTAVGMRQFAVIVAPGTWGDLELATFEHCVSEACTALMHDQIQKMLLLRESGDDPSRKLRSH